MIELTYSGYTNVFIIREGNQNETALVAIPWLAGVDASGGGGVGRIVNRPLHRRMLRVFPGLFLHGSIV